MTAVLPAEEAVGYDDLTASLRDADFRRRFYANRQYAAMVRTTFAVTMLRGSAKSNVIPPEATAQIDCRMLAGDDPNEIAEWVRRAVADPNVQVQIARDPKIPNLSPPDTELYKAMADTLRAGAGRVVARWILVAHRPVFGAAGFTATASARSSSRRTSSRRSTATTSASHSRTCARASAPTWSSCGTWRGPRGDTHGTADPVEERRAVRGHDFLRRRR
jgi:hypothetical protein